MFEVLKPFSAALTPHNVEPLAEGQKVEFANEAVDIDGLVAEGLIAPVKGGKKAAAKDAAA